MPEGKEGGRPPIVEQDKDVPVDENKDVPALNAEQLDKMKQIYEIDRRFGSAFQGTLEHNRGEQSDEFYDAVGKAREAFWELRKSILTDIGVTDEQWNEFFLDALEDKYGK